ncbi:MAG: hypothetical protein WBL31_11455 [Ilumatobacteraceae bacterium]
MNVQPNTARRVGLTVIGALLVAAATVTPDVAEVADAAPPEHRVTLFSDSVGLGAAGALPKAFPADWQVNTIGTPAYMVEQLRDRHVVPTLATNRSIIGDHVVIGSGYNYPHWDPARFDRSIDSMIETLTAAGVKHVYWVTLREVKPQYVSASAWQGGLEYLWYFPTVNQHLERAAQRHPNLTLVDWAAAADQPGLTYDAIHLNPTGAALYSSLIANAVMNNETRLDNGVVTRVHVADGTSTRAVAVNLTATGTRTVGWFAAYPCDGPRPQVSNLNHVRDHTVAAAAVIPVGPSGDICVHNDTSAQVIVDLFGRFDDSVNVVDADPVRLHDSRPSGVRQAAYTELRLRVGARGAGGAVALNVTALEADAPGFVTVHACGTSGLETSNVNVTEGSVTPNLVMATPDPQGDICITASTAVHLIVDRFVSFGVDASIDVPPARRVVDTRSDGSVRAAGRVVRVRAVPARSGAANGGVFMNVTLVDADGEGYGTVYPCAEGRPDTSNVNVASGQTIANFAVVRPDVNGEICVYSSVAADVLVDVLGSAGPGFQGIRPQRLVDSRSRLGTT